MATARYEIRVLGAAARFACAHDERVLIAMERAGLATVPVGCRGGGCGICKVEVLEGDYRCGPMSRVHVSAAEEAAGAALACKVFPKSDLVLRPLGKCFDQTRYQEEGASNHGC
ncbi:MAG: 2Fe-2S iron-sulfur cluster-binding protein [Sphingomonadales bacterium]|nr:2Fe-2S iron-sulfur cluster-binding protein [Sphingomonadales bacterium]